MGLREIVIFIFVAVIFGGMLACALPRKWVPVKHKRWISLVFMVIFGLVIVAPGDRLTGLAWFAVFTGAHLMFTDMEKWRPTGKAVVILGFILAFGHSAITTARRQEQQHHAVTQE